ncbi:hypothetical protein RN001_011716 [Aquatica leii]|uniref:Osiris 19 n=1 Tax=Aquatica leii TaxID=1421715 RepID=A0AAN7SER1_9COLE|nr:hypothetical protein RN001_011716 [Aquatica leii]
MELLKVSSVLMLIAFSVASPASKSAFWKDTALDNAVEEMRSLCANNDAISCLKYKFMSFLDGFFKKDSYQILDNININRNGFHANEISGRSDASLEDNVQDYIQSHDVTFKLPFEGSSVTVASGNLDKDEIDLKLRLSDSGSVQARKSKLKKIIVPIFIFILLKAITVIPLALGVLGLKAWNALQLSFFSFVISITLAVFQLCKKIASDHHHAHLAHPWDAAYARSFDAEPVPVKDDEAQKLAYSAYA